MNRLVIASLLVLGMSGVVAAETPATATETTQMMNCGEMMKSMIPLPTKFAELMTAVADGMNAHAAWMETGTDEASKAEAAAMKKLAQDHQQVAIQMKKIVNDMKAGSKIMPAAHDMSKMDPKATEGMMKQATLAREMAALMIKHAEDTEKMAQSMSAPKATASHSHSH